MTGKIEYLSASEINKEEWDDRVKASLNRRIYATSRFLEIFSPRWEAIVLNDGQAFMPVTCHRKYGINYVFQPVFVQQLGFFFLDASASGSLPGILEKLCSHFSFIDISMNEMNDILQLPYNVKRMSNFILPLDRPYPLIAGDYNNCTRRNITKARRLGISMDPDYTPSEIIRLFMKNNGSKFSDITSENYNRLQKVIEGGLAGGITQIRAARTINGDIIAAACFLTDFDRYVFYFSANTEEGKLQGAMPWLIDDFIRERSGNNMLMDFNGSMNPGIARLYKGFGARQTFYYRLKVNNLVFPVKYFK
jgi:hypothetical protein